MKKEDLNADPQSMDNRRLSAIARNPNHPQATHAKAELARRKVKKAEMDEGGMKRIATTQSNKADRIASGGKKGLETFKKREMQNETKGAPKGYHFTRSGKLRKGDAGADGPGGAKLRSDPLDKQRSKIPPLPEKFANAAQQAAVMAKLKKSGKYDGKEAYNGLQSQGKDPEEYDKEGSMMKSQLRKIDSAVDTLMNMVNDNDNLPEWVQSKMTKATDYIRSVRDYLESESMSEEVDRKQLIHHGEKTKNFEICPSALKAFADNQKNGMSDKDGFHEAVVAVDKYLGIEKSLIKKGFATDSDMERMKAAVNDAKQKIKAAGLPGHSYHQIHLDAVKELMKKKTVVEKTLTPAEIRKRDKIAKAIKKYDPDMPMDRKMAIATAKAKKVAEATDDDYHKTLGSTKNSDEGIAALKKKHGMSHTKAVATMKRLMGEGKVDEISMGKMQAYGKAAAKDIDQKRNKVKAALDQPASVKHAKAGMQAMQGLTKRSRGSDMYVDKITGRSKVKPTAEETVNELDKKTLGSYIKKAGPDAVKQTAQAKRHSDAGDMADKDRDMYKHYAKSQRAMDKAKNRQKGIGKAVDKLTKEATADPDTVRMMKDNPHMIGQDGPGGMKGLKKNTQKKVKQTLSKDAMSLARIRKILNREKKK